MVEARQGLFENALRGKLTPASADDSAGWLSIILEEEHTVGDLVLKLQLVRI